MVKKRKIMSVLIKNGRIITATDDYVADIFIEGETISAIGKNLNVNAISNKSQVRTEFL